MTERQLRELRLACWSDGLFWGFLFGLASGAVITLAVLWPYAKVMVIRP